MRWAAATAHRWIWPPAPRDENSPDGRPRGGDVIVAENQRLHVELAHLRTQLDQYRVLVGEREKLGSLAERCVRLSVFGGDSGNRRSLNFAGRQALSLRAGMAALTPGGVLAVWSAFPDKGFASRLKRAGFAVEELDVRATGGRKGARHVIWLAVKPGR